jgi:predicted MPP superfamily phosphohydrolase
LYTRESRVGERRPDYSPLGVSVADRAVRKDRTASSIAAGNTISSIYAGTVSNYNVPMYLLTEIVLLSPLIVYAGFRIRRLQRGKVLKNAATAFFALLVAGYPIAEFLSHNSGDGWTRYAMIAGYLFLPYLLYIVLTVVASDILVGLLYWPVGLSAQHISRFRTGRILLIFLLPATIVALGAVNNNRLQIKHYTLEVPRRSSKRDVIRIAFASDFHLGRLTNRRLLYRFVEKVNSLNTDLVLIAGDVLEGDRQDDVIEFETQFARIRSRYGTYAVPGNHEMQGRNRGEFFLNSGITLLQDSVVKVDDSFYLAGRNDGRSRNLKSVEELLRNTPRNLPLVLLDHRPDELSAASNCGVDLQLSGHTHDGQLFPINLLYPMRYELTWGYLRKLRTHFIVTSGVQAWGPPVRTAGDSEVVAIDLILRDGSVSVVTIP